MELQFDTMGGSEQMTSLLEKLDKHKIFAGSCLHIKKLKDTNSIVQKKIISTGVKYTKESNQVLS